MMCSLWKFRHTKHAQLSVDFAACEVRGRNLHGSVNEKTISRSLGEHPRSGIAEVSVTTLALDVGDPTIM